LDFFADELGCHIVHCPTVVAPPDSPWYVDLPSVVQHYAAAVRHSMASLSRGRPRVLSTVVRWLRSVTHQRPVPSYCPAGRSAWTVDVLGDIYPCFMLMGWPAARPGGVDQSNYTESAWLKELLAASDTHTREDCSRCWLQPLCFGCLGDDLARGDGRLKWSTVPGQSSVCDFRRALGVAFLEGLAAAISHSLAPVSSITEHGP
ncbi:MAG: SPASM domain-containing protein, partial [Phycisphaerales bacterium]